MKKLGILKIVGGIAALATIVSGVLALVSFFRPVDDLDQTVEYLVRIEAHLNRIVRVQPPQVVSIKDDVTPPENNPLSTGATIENQNLRKVNGWIYLGKYNFNAHRWSTTTVDSEAIPGKGDSITLIGSVHFRDNKPSGLFYRKGNLKNPPVLPAGTTVMVKEVDEKIGLGNYSWALVEANIPH
ncbi:MAG: ABC transporter ATP-binding protein [Deltaproteobacteria bacterium]|nr:ABC transporter ATP-binding protein [Deltaproteobacteria bacterium]MBW2166195.1 ABC transporter ATP-binding protein [Deltaproteobacteria bacterium]